MTSQQIIDKLIQIELYTINPRRSPTNDELEWKNSHIFFAEPTEREFYPKIQLNYDEFYIIDYLDCDSGSPKVKLKGVDKFYDYKEFSYALLPKSFIGLGIDNIKGYYYLNYRISKIDGKPQLLTSDYNLNRINFEVENGIIVNQYNG